MQKIRTTVNIAGKDYTISSYDDEAHVKRVAAYVDRRLTELNTATRLPAAQLAVMVAMDVTDEMLKAQDEVRRMRAELADARDAMEAMRLELEAK